MADRPGAAGAARVPVLSALILPRLHHCRTVNGPRCTPSSSAEFLDVVMPVLDKLSEFFQTGHLLFPLICLHDTGAIRAVSRLVAAPIIFRCCRLCGAFHVTPSQFVATVNHPHQPLGERPAGKAGMVAGFTQYLPHGIRRFGPHGDLTSGGYGIRKPAACFATSLVASGCLLAIAPAFFVAVLINQTKPTHTRKQVIRTPLKRKTCHGRSPNAGDLPQPTQIHPFNNSPKKDFIPARMARASLVPQPFLEAIARPIRRRRFISFLTMTMSL